MIALPQVPITTARHGFPWASTWIVGAPPKVGKSKFAEGLWRTTGKPVLHIDTENSTEDLGGYIVRPKSLPEVREIVQQLRQGSPYAAHVIDTLDVINTWAEEETCKEFNVGEMGSDEINPDTGKSKTGFGSDWARSRKKVLNIVESLQLTGKLLLLIVHTKVEKGAFSGTTIAVPQGLGIALRGGSQVIGYIQCEESRKENRVKRLLTFAPSEGLVAGSRYHEMSGQYVYLELKDDQYGKYVDWSPIFALFGESPR